MTIQDNGIGMDQTTLDKVLDPFFTTRKTRDVGLGLSLLKANCIIAGGNIAATITCLILSEEKFNLGFTYQY
ncbi:MAG: hypothetical protein KAH05_01615, partial [Clostridiales bacterium]|nr:hypothetical protein [Clostridiales bacterium]